MRHGEGGRSSGSGATAVDVKALPVAQPSLQILFGVPAALPSIWVGPQVSVFNLWEARSNQADVTDFVGLPLAGASAARASDGLSESETQSLLAL